MSRFPCVKSTLIAASFIAFAAFAEPTLRAAMLYVYDLDSLVHLSSDVAEGEIVRRYSAHNQDLLDVKVSLVHKGGFKKEQTVAVLHDYYRKPKKGDINTHPLAVGDRLVIFAVRAQPSDFFRIPKDAVLYAPLRGGMRLIEKDYVFSFHQRDNPGPYVANMPHDRINANLLTVEGFRAKVHGSLRDTIEWERLLEAKPDNLDVPRLMKLLEDRSEQSYDGIDYFTQHVCMRFAETHDPPLLSRALPLAKSYYDTSILYRGFGTPTGRDYLLAKVTDEKEPMAARMRYSYALRNAGNVYRETYTEIRSNSWRPVGKADEGNSGYLTRVAKAAQATMKTEELCRSLIRSLDYFGQGIVQNEPAPLMHDLKNAFGVLKEIYETKPSEEIQFAIEKATAYDRESFEKLKSPCGTFISILRAVDPAKYTKPAEPSLIFEYEYASSLLNRDTEVQPSVVMFHQGTQKSYVLPTELRIRGWSTGGGSNSVVLPKDLRQGRYHVFLQLRDGEKVISTGHFFAADL